MSLPTFSEQEVAAHNTADSLWISIDNIVYDITAFQESHPGGRDVLLDNAGTNATAAFAGVGHSADALEMRKAYVIGVLEGAPPGTLPPAPPPPKETPPLDEQPPQEKSEKPAQSQTPSSGGTRSSEEECCSNKTGFYIGAALGVFAVCAGAYFAYKKLKK